MLYDFETSRVNHAIFTRSRRLIWRMLKQISQLLISTSMFQNCGISNHRLATGGKFASAHARANEQRKLRNTRNACLQKGAGNSKPKQYNKSS